MGFRNLASQAPAWEQAWTSFTAELTPSPGSTAPLASPPPIMSATYSPSPSPSPSTNDTGYSPFTFMPSAPLAGILIAVVAAAAVCLTSASIVALLRFTYSRRRRQRQFDADAVGGEPRHRDSDEAAGADRWEFVDGDIEAGTATPHGPPKLPAIVLQPDGVKVDFAVEDPQSVVEGVKESLGSGQQSPESAMSIEVDQSTQTEAGPATIDSVINPADGAEAGSTGAQVVARGGSRRVRRLRRSRHHELRYQPGLFTVEVDEVGPAAQHAPPPSPLPSPSTET